MKRRYTGYPDLDKRLFYIYYRLFILLDVMNDNHPCSMEYAKAFRKYANASRYRDKYLREGSVRRANFELDVYSV